MTDPQSRRYLREFIPAMAGYLIVLPISIILLLKADMPPVLRGVVALLPMLFVMRAIVRHMLRQGGMQRIELSAVTITCALAGIATFSVGFLQNVHLLPSPPWLMLWILPLMIGTYGVTRALVTRRYQ